MQLGTPNHPSEFDHAMSNAIRVRQRLGYIPT